MHAERRANGHLRVISQRHAHQSLLQGFESCSNFSWLGVRNKCVKAFFLLVPDSFGNTFGLGRCVAREQRYQAKRNLALEVATSAPPVHHDTEFVENATIPVFITHAPIKYA